MFIVHDRRIAHQVFAPGPDAGSVQRMAYLILNLIFNLGYSFAPQMGCLTQSGYSINDRQLDWM